MGLDLSKVLLLDPEAKEELVPDDAKQFDYLLFGGILGKEFIQKKYSLKYLFKVMILPKVSECEVL
jgi:ribosome biogenesis SPOUT family RNA methylase Rps3